MGGKPGADSLKKRSPTDMTPVQLEQADALVVQPGRHNAAVSRISIRFGGREQFAHPLFTEYFGAHGVLRHPPWNRSCKTALTARQETGSSTCFNFGKPELLLPGQGRLMPFGPGLPVVSPPAAGNY